MWYNAHVFNRIPRTALLATVVGLALSVTACSSLTKPEEITIAAEPLPSRATAPAPQGANPAQQFPAPAPAAPAGTG